MNNILILHKFFSELFTIIFLIFKINQNNIIKIYEITIRIKSVKSK